MDEPGSGLLLEGQPSDRRTAKILATMASDTAIAYTPTGYVIRTGRVVWHEMQAEDLKTHQCWAYYLRRDAGSYAGSFGNERI